ncbi:MAG: YggS family pyridoxal phosphate-dependent enzyme [Nitrospirota bacterium]
MLRFYAMGIRDALNNVRDKINNSAVKAGRNPEDIKLIAVSKTVELPKIVAAVKAGASILGENRIQEARNKITELRAENPYLKPEWHLIGNLQKNKVKIAVQLFDLIHSLDSVELAEALNNYSDKAGKKQRVLVQVKLSDEITKHGVPERDVIQLVQKVTEMKHLQIDGLMTIPPFFDDIEKTRPYFRKLRELRDKLSSEGLDLSELSMGMSGDFKVAIEEGATMVRVGTAIFGERNY